MFLDKKGKHNNNKTRSKHKTLARAGNRTRDLSPHSLESNLTANETTEQVDKS